MIRRSALQLAYLFRTRLKSSEKLDLRSVAIIATEMRFRPTYFRLFEYMVLLVLLIANRKPNISVGISQMSYRHWNFAADATTFEIMRRVLNPHENYRVVRRFLIYADSTEMALRKYNTRTSKLYFHEFSKNLSLIEKSRLGHRFPHRCVCARD